MILTKFSSAMHVEQLDTDAEWWFPGSNIKFKGKLIFDKDIGGTLTIQGSQEPFILLDTSQNYTEESKEEPTHPEKVCKREDNDKLIFGETKDKKKITLLYSLPPTGNSVSAENYSFVERKYKIKFIFMGIHFESIDDIMFESFVVEYSNLPNWIQSLSHELTGYAGIGPDRDKNRYLFEHRYGKTLDINIETKCLIQFLSYPEINIDILTAGKISHHIYAKIKSIRNKKLDEYIILKNVLQDFFNFVTTNEVRTVRMIGNHKVVYDEHELVESVEIYYRSSISERMDKVKVMKPHLLWFDDMYRFTDTVKKWFILSDTIGATYDLYFGVMYNYYSYITNKFLMLAEALETYIGIISKRAPGPELERKIARVDHISKILDECQLSKEYGLTEDDKEWVKLIIGEKKFLPFRDKMEKAYDIYCEILPDLSSVIGSKEDFARSVQKSRNRLTHGNIDYDQLETKEIFWNFKNLQLILQLCMLSELDLSMDMIKKIYLLDRTAMESSVT